jgi:hypothetical protein
VVRHSLLADRDLHLHQETSLPAVRDWNAVLAGLTIFAVDFFNETWNGWVRTSPAVAF